MRKNNRLHLIYKIAETPSRKMLYIIKWNLLLKPCKTNNNKKVTKAGTRQVKGLKLKHCDESKAAFLHVQF